jgi:hypothetical protein
VREPEIAVVHPPVGTGFRLLDAFRKLFFGVQYRPRRSTQGDAIAAELYEDLYIVASGRSGSAKLVSGVNAGSRVLNPKNRTRGLTVRRGDGTFGEIIPGQVPVAVAGFVVQRAENAFVEIGCEVKILATAQQRQARRVDSDLRDQASDFKHRTGVSAPITVAVVGVNYAQSFVSVLGKNTFPTNGSGANRHPFQEAAQARAIVMSAQPLYDHFILIEYEATNIPPYPFAFVNLQSLRADYAAVLARIARDYEARF